MKITIQIFFLLSIFIFSGCSLNVNEMNGNQASETGLAVDDQTPRFAQTWATKKREQHLEPISDYLSWAFIINKGIQEYIDRSLILEEVPFDADEKITTENLWALTSKQIIKASWFDKLFSGDITQKVFWQSMFACDLDERFFWAWARSPCAYFKYSFDKFTFTKLAGGAYHTLQVEDWKLKIRSSKESYWDWTLVFWRYKLPTNISFKDFMSYYHWTKDGLCLSKYNAIRRFSYWEGNPKYAVYKGGIDSGYYFNESRERILYTGDWYQWSEYFWWNINQLLREKKAEIFQLGIIDNFWNRWKWCINSNTYLAFHIQWEPYFYMIGTTLLWDSISLSDMDWVSDFFIDIEE